MLDIIFELLFLNFVESAMYVFAILSICNIFDIKDHKVWISMAMITIIIYIVPIISTPPYSQIMILIFISYYMHKFHEIKLLKALKYCGLIMLVFLICEVTSVSLIFKILNIDKSEYFLINLNSRILIMIVPRILEFLAIYKIFRGDSMKTWLGDIEKRK